MICEEPVEIPISAEIRNVAKRCSMLQDLAGTKTTGQNENQSLTQLSRKHLLSHILLQTGVKKA